MSFSPYIYSDNRPPKYSDPWGLYVIDPSCSCPADDQPSTPKSSNESPPGLNTKDLQLGVDAWCAIKYLQEITDPKLRECIGKSCDTGKIKCKDNCDVETYVGLNRKVPFIKNRIAVVCTNAPPWSLTPEALGETVIHEWAHGCGWDHGDGRGVPRDPGSLEGAPRNSTNLI